MTPEQICAALRDKGSSQVKIASELGVSQVLISRVINRANVSDRIMRAIADKIRCPVQKIFPEYYLSAPKNSRSKAFGPKPRPRKAE